MPQCDAVQSGAVWCGKVEWGVLWHNDGAMVVKTHVVQCNVVGVWCGCGVGVVWVW